MRGIRLARRVRHDPGTPSRIVRAHLTAQSRVPFPQPAQPHQEFSVLFGFRSRSLLSWAVELGEYGDGGDPTKVLDRCKASGRSKLTREPKQIDAQLGKQTGAELSALFVRRCLVPPSGLCRPVWISRMTKPAEDRVAGEFNPAGRLTGPCDIFSIDVSPWLLRVCVAWCHEIDAADLSGRRKCRVCILALRRAAGGSSHKNSNRSPHPGKANRHRIIGASRKPLFRSTFRFAWSSLD